MNYIDAALVPMITLHLRRQRKYFCTRQNAAIRLWTEPTPDGTLIRYEIAFRRGQVVNGYKLTVGGAIRDINASIAKRCGHTAAPVEQPKPKPLARPRVAWTTPAERYRLPYADK